MTPQQTPPPEMRDPIVNRVKVDPHRWRDVVRGHLPIHLAAVGHTVARYADNDTGENAFPGVTRLAEDLLTSERTIIRALATLTTLGWLHQTEQGGRVRQRNNAYCLTIPVPVAIPLGWVPENTAPWMERR
ncbi:helix-turn-helix domain-containing protein [Pseudonocardia ammonioxydans]|uniref:helix-turn-helix domain-containing protein n=1 Tax=Pseudonocardia ammonioxydans TaxID=260086 RepID=UPI0015A6C896|nr:helix-turn-helix domain-containing protein [Pseudonocardia ammonioxydans]